MARTDKRTEKPISERPHTGFLPITREEMRAQGIEQPDFVYVSGDAYVDHPSFGPAIITRILQAHGYSVGFIAQPDWLDPESINVFGEPRLGFIVSAGNMDSMVNHYTVALKHRHTDAYSPGGVMGKRPDRAVIVYSNLIRKTYKKTPIILGGLEASLRRLGHYDYWSDKVRRSVLLDAGADIISYGMGEQSIVEIADALNAGIDVKDITFIRGTVYKTRREETLTDAIRLPDFETISENKSAYAAGFATQFKNTDPYRAKTLYEVYGGKMCVVQNPPAYPLSTMAFDDIYELPFMNSWHPIYDKDGGIPAIAEVQFSITANRGCFGGCHFCALTFHQGRIVQSRSEASILKEAKAMTQHPAFKGYIHDVGGPTANFMQPACKKQLTKGTCPDRQCLFPTPCPNMKADHKAYLRVLKAVRELPGVKKVFVRSGIRFDYMMADADRTFLQELCAHHISGQLRVAPEHVSDNVLRHMGKPAHKVYESFVETFEKVNKRTGREQYLVPYLMSSHPGSRLEDAITLAEYLHSHHLRPDQVQDFYPTPGTVSTCMYHTGLDPLTMEPVYVVTNPHEKALQRALVQYWMPENHALVKEALLKAGRGDLIGFDEYCLIPPRVIARGKYAQGKSPSAGRGNAGGRGGHDSGKNAAASRGGQAGGKGKSAGRGNNTERSGKGLNAGRGGNTGGKGQITGRGGNTRSNMSSRNQADKRGNNNGGRSQAPGRVKHQTNGRPQGGKGSGRGRGRT
ncbi:MAG: YgiQ family radical SAM protein [Lachnospiraceae bacterium]|nr:YgiQ family radical SAM protein [Lachnospiraceae bacterium]